jgi:predicted metal-dependent peptidase
VTTPKLDAATALTRAVSQLLIHQPFFGNLAFRLRRIEAMWQPTMGTDGVHMFYNTEFVDRLSPQQLIACVAHEVLHNAFQHFLRRGDRDPMRMNLGGDMAINPIIRDAGLDVPKEAVFPASFQLPEGQWMEWYADHLPQQMTCKCGGGKSGCRGVAGPPGSGPICTEDHGGCSGVYPLPGVGKDGQPDRGVTATDSQRQQAASDWQTAAIQAATAARAAGKLPAALDRFVDQLHAPSVDWRDVLRRFVSAVVKDDYRMFPPNRRFISSGLYMPSMRSDSIGEILIVVDASGSIGGAEFAAFASEANAILEETRPSRVHLLYHATRVHQHEEYTPDEYPVRFSTAESGGTNFQCVFDYVTEHGIDPVACVWFTDMYPDGWPDAESAGFPVLWAATTDVEAPWGETVRVRVEAGTS